MKRIISSNLLILLCLPIFANAKYFEQTNHFALKQGQDWSWSAITKAPKVKWHAKTPTFYSDHYFLTGGFGKYITIHAEGATKNKPTAINIMMTYHERERNSKNIYKLYDFFNKSELKEAKSNCTKKLGTMNADEYQNFYQWNKKGSKPLYIGVRKFRASDGHIDHNHVIVQDFHQFNSLTSFDLAIDRYDSDANEITCRLL